jgi:DNA-binding beta-propeller fold protein YncE
VACSHRGARRSGSRLFRVVFAGVLILVLCPWLTSPARAAVGGLTARGCIAEAGADGCKAGKGLSGIHGMVVSPDGKDLYAVGKWTASSGPQGQVVEFKRNTTTGALTEIGCLAEGGVDGCAAGHGLIGAAGIAISPNGADVYVASDTSDAIVHFRRNAATGALAEEDCVAAGGTDGCSPGAGLVTATGIAVSPDGADVYAASESSDAITEFQRNAANGGLTEIGCIAEAAAGGCTAGTGLTHAENIVLSGDGTSLYATALDGNAVAEFERNALTGALAETGCIAEAGADGCAVGNGLSGADGIAISPDGSSVYVAAETGGALASFTRSPSGALTEQGCTAESGSDGCSTTPGINGAARVTVSVNGANVYAAGYFGDTIATFARAANGALTFSGCLGEPNNADGCTPVRGLIRPAGLALSPDGHNLYAGSQLGNAIVTFASGPQVSHTSLTGLAAKRPRLAFSLTASSGGPIKRVIVDLPSGLRFVASGGSPRDGVTVRTSKGAHLKATIKVNGRVLRIAPDAEWMSGRVAISSPAIAASQTLSSQARHGRAPPLRIVVKVTEAGATNVFRITLKAS